jgi:hypothetical protein
MPPVSKILIGKNPSLWEIERANIESSRTRQAAPQILQLSRHTRANLFADITISKLVATLSRRSGSLIIRDYHNSWTGKATHERFLKSIDGISALVHCGETPQRRLENVGGELAPQSLYDELYARMLITAKMEDDAGPSRTYLAIDPTFGVPIELKMSAEGLDAFRREIRSIMRQFREWDDKHQITLDAEDNLYKAVFEIFQNTYEHGRFGPNSEILSGIRYVRFRQYIGNTVSDMVRRTTGFAPLQSYVKRRGGERGSRRFLAISIGDNGMGIITHFLKSKSESQTPAGGRVDLINQILTQNLSSKHLSGCGLGLPNALLALSTLKAFVALRSDDLWLYRDFSDPEEQRGSRRWLERGLSLRPVETPEPLASMSGTQFSILTDFAL